jgi:hypothetical protein
VMERSNVVMAFFAGGIMGRLLTEQTRRRQ